MFLIKVNQEERGRSTMVIGEVENNVNKISELARRGKQEQAGHVQQVKKKREIKLP